MRIRKLVTSVALTLLSSSVFATPVLTNTLQDALDSRTEGGAFYDVNTAQYNPDEQWQISSAGSQISVLLFELASLAANSTFGIYDLNDVDLPGANSLDDITHLQLYDGSEATGETRQLHIDDSQIGTSTGVGFGVFDKYGSYLSHQYGFVDRNFGYYLDSSASANGGLFFSEAYLNSNTGGGNGGNTDHMLAFRGDGELRIDVDGVGTGAGYSPFGQSEYILAFEGQSYDSVMPDNSNFDFADFVVLVQGVYPTGNASVPEPEALWLLAIGIFGLATIRRRRQLALITP